MRVKNAFVVLPTFAAALFSTFKQCSASFAKQTELKLSLLCLESTEYTESDGNAPF